MFINLPNYNYGAYEARVRRTMNYEGVAHEDYPYLWAQPHPRIPNIQEWLISTIGEQGSDWQVWHGWLMFKHESDAVIMNMVWHDNTDYVQI